MAQAGYSTTRVAAERVAGTEITQNNGTPPLRQEGRRRAEAAVVEPATLDRDRALKETRNGRGRLHPLAQDEQARKRPRVEEPVADDGWEFDPDHLPTDAEVALDFLKPRQPPSLGVGIPRARRSEGSRESRKGAKEAGKRARSPTSSSPPRRRTSPCSPATSTAPC